MSLLHVLDNFMLNYRLPLWHILFKLTLAMQSINIICLSAGNRSSRNKIKYKPTNHTDLQYYQ